MHVRAQNGRGGLFIGEHHLESSTGSCTHHLSPCAAMDQYLCGVRAVVLEQGMGKGRARILCRHLKTRGGSVLARLSDATTHILVGSKIRRSRLPALLGVSEVSSDVHVVRADWLSSCLIRGELVGEDEFTVPMETPSPGKDEKGGHLKGGREERGGEGEGTRGSPVKSAVKAAAEGGEAEAGEGEGGGEDQQCVAERVSAPDSTSFVTSLFSCDTVSNIITAMAC